VAVLGYRLWQSRFRGDADVLGRTIHINGHIYTVIGVGPEGMVGVEGPALTDLVIPAMEGRGERGWRSYTAVARKLPGVTKEQVQAELDALAAHLLEEYPEIWGSESIGTRRFEVTTLHEAMIPDGAPMALIVAAFLGVVGLILLIACSNVANLLLTRALERRSEIAIRSAIGARSGRIAAQLLTESLVLFAIAGGLSILVTYWLSSLASAGSGLLPPPAVSVTVDARVILFALGMALATGLTFGLVPALQSSRPDLVPSLKGREAPPRFRLFGVRNLLVGAQVGGSMVLVLVTLLLLQSLGHARSLDLGFDPEGVAVLFLDLDHGDYQEADGRQFLTDLRGRIEALPSVQATALATRIPLEGGSSAFGGLIPEGHETSGKDGVTIGFAAVSPGYLDLVGVQLLRGRDFTQEDRPEGERVVLASRALIDRFWSGESGLGRRIASGDEESYTVVGVVEDIPWQSPAEEAQPFLWFPTTQWWDSRIVVHVRSGGDLASLLPELRAQVADLNPDLPVRRVDRMASISANGTLLNRILSAVLGGAGLVTLSLAMLGIYGVVSFSVRQRTREVGLRIAVGAERGQVVRMVVLEGVGLALLGLVPGLLVGLAVARLMRAALLGLSPLDPVAFLGGTSLLLLAVVAASLSPALKAARADPMDALRTE
jgi:predicted permease